MAFPPTFGKDGEARHTHPPSVLQSSPVALRGWHVRDFHPVQQIAVAICVGLVFVVLREAATALIGDVKAYIYFVLPILLCGYLFGALSGFTMATIGFVQTWVRFSPDIALDIQDTEMFYSAVLHAIVGTVCVIAMDSLRNAQRRVADSAILQSRAVMLLDSLIDNSPLGIALYDRTGARLRCNPRYLVLTASHETEMIGGLISSEDSPLRPKLAHTFQEVLATKRAIEGVMVEIDNFEKSGKLHLSCSFVPVFDEQTQPYGVAVLLSDMTDLQQSRLELDRLLDLEKAARQDAESAMKMKDEFVAMLSHELRTPLTAILGWSELMRARANEAEFVRDGTDAIAQSTRAQMRMVEDLLDLSRVKTGRLHLDRDITDVGDLVTDVVRNVRNGSGREIFVERFDECLVDGDAQRLTQVFSNIIDNAVKYSKSDTPIEVAVSRTGREVVVTVTDHGIGIDPDMLESIFDRFRQGEAGHRRRYGGLGLGLAIVRELVQLHGGTVFAASAGPDQGSTFTVVLPAALATRMPFPTRPAGAAVPELEENLHGYRIMLVDDDDQTRDVLYRMLVSVGANVDAYPCPLEALEGLSSKSYDVIVSDIAMPKMDGYEFLSKVRSSGRASFEAIPAIALSAYTRTKDRRAALQAGFDAYLNKPVDLASLVETIRSTERPVPGPV